jgi:glycosyltransferase involved in cell wall biosynthesis
LAAAKKITENQKNCYFLLIGERQDHDHAEGVDDIIELSKEALGDKLILTGYRTDIPKLLHAMDLYVLPSWREGMPRSIIEAMMIGVPVLATNIRGSREEVIHEVTGLLVPVKSPIALEHAMTKFICNPEWSRKLGMEGRRQALKHFNEQNVVELQLNLIEQFASRP